MPKMSIKKKTHRNSNTTSTYTTSTCSIRRSAAHHHHHHENPTHTASTSSIRANTNADVRVGVGVGGSSSTNSTSTSIVHHSNATITRKRLFQFLFKNYMRSAYSGITKEPTSAADVHAAPHSTSISSSTSAPGPAAAAAGGRATPATSSSTKVSFGETSTSSALATYGCTGPPLSNDGPLDFPAAASASNTSRGGITTSAASSSGGSAAFRAAAAMRKRELRTEYFNDMSECYTQSQRYRRVEQPLVSRIIMQHRKVVVGPMPAATAAITPTPPPSSKPTPSSGSLMGSEGEGASSAAAAIGAGTPMDVDDPSSSCAGAIACGPTAARLPAGKASMTLNIVAPLGTKSTTTHIVPAVSVSEATTTSSSIAISRSNSSRTMTVTQPMDKQISQTDDIGWGKKVSVTLVREPSTSFGVCIVGGKVNISKNLQVAGIFIKNIVPASPAETCKQIKIGDRILSVNSRDVRNATQEETIGLIKNAGCRIELVLQSFDGSNLPDPPAAQQVPLKSAIKADTSLQNTRTRSVRISSVAVEHITMPDNVAAPTSPVADNADATQTNSSSANNDTASKRFPSGSDSSSDDDDDEEEETSGKVTTKAGFDIDRKSAGNLKRTKEEAAADPEAENQFGYTDQKLKKKYGPLGGRIIRANIQRDAGSMGLALAGCRDRNKMGCFVAGINPKGSASSQNVKVGDEILEISGIYLHRTCHLNASVIIKGIPGITLEFILLRLDNAVEDMAVKPVISFPTAFDQFDQLYSCFKNVRNVTIQKVGTSLGIMIIEGKHSEVGQGIFISDIQENSNAETAGVKIGEMVLAVNKDLLIDTNYDTAAGLLKRAEGIVTLTLCNPNKKEGEIDEKKDGTANGVVASDGKAGAAEEKKPEKPPEPEKPKDPATDKIDANKDTVIEINADKKPLGVVVVKGDSSQVQSGASVIVIHENGAVHKDNRLRVFDKIVEIDGKKISSETSDHDINKIFQRIYPRVKMTVYRAEPPDLKEMDVEITKKSGKDIGLSFAECKENGIYVLDIIPGSEVDKDKRMIRGDIVTHINGDDIRKSNFIESTILLKAAQTKISFKVVRPKGKK